MKRTADANEAATSAAVTALDESRTQYDRHVIAQAHSLIREAKLYVTEEKWGFAALRLSDLADLVTQVGEEDDEWTGLATRLRGMETSFEQMCKKQKETISSSLNTKWRGLYKDVCEKIAKNFGPFSPVDQETKK